jgi:hypothetical protein
MIRIIASLPAGCEYGQGVGGELAGAEACVAGIGP